MESLIRSKNMESNNGGGGGIGVSSVLTIVFIVLKVVGVIDWSWVWVLSPIWISTAVALIILLVWYINGDWWLK